MAKTELEKQNEYAQKLTDSGYGFDLVVGDAFVRGMRDIGYKHTGTAMDEIVDNALEANAKNIHVVFKHAPKGSKPEAIAIVDDGHGMSKDMLRPAVVWGGAHRENSRSGIGRYGYGLPSASVSQGERFTVYSKTEGKNWFAITVDLQDIRAGKYTSVDNRIVTPPPREENLPAWLEPFQDLSSGTVVIWEKLDRLTWTSLSGLTGNLIEHFGVVYRNFLSKTRLYVAETLVEPIDPLFITPGFRYYDYDEQIAQALEPLKVPVKVEGRDERAVITIRASVLPYGFGAVEKDRPISSKNQNPRWSIMNGYKGIIVTRMGRHMDEITRTPKIWKYISTITNNDSRYWAIEIDFPASLDEEFSVTTSKQRVELSDRIWDILTNQGGLERTISSLNKMAKEDRNKHTENADKGDGARVSEKVMKENEKFKLDITGETTEERKKSSIEAFEREFKRRKEKATKGKAEEELRQELEEELQQQPYKVSFESLPTGPFFRVEQVGPQFVLNINRKHVFYDEIYMSGGPKIKTALELLLFVIGQSELDSEGNKEKKLFYVSEKLLWSRNLENVLELMRDTVVADEDEHDDTATDEEAA